MPESLYVSKNATKPRKYIELLPQIEALTEDESNLYANLANVSACLKDVFGFLWVGFYLVDETVSNQLVLGPFQGPIACTRIRYGKGVCGASWEKKETIVVPDVEKFPGHIACSNRSKSEIVVPLFNRDKSKILGVLDVDSEELGTFDEIDSENMTKICDLVSRKC